MIRNLKSQEKKDRIPLFVYLATFFIIYFSSSFSLSVYQGTTRMLFFLALFLLLIFAGLRHKGRIVDINLPILVVLSAALFSYIINTEDIKYFIILLSYYALIIVFINCIRLELWQLAYVRIMFLISIASLLLYFISLFFPHVLSILPMVRNSANLHTHSLFIAVSPINNRNFGVFWEPGSFQTYLGIALIIDIFKYKFENKLRLFIFVIALITTFSTTGYIVLCLITIAVLASGMFDEKLRKSVKYLIIILILGIGTSYFMIQNMYPSLYYVLFGKISAFSATGNLHSSTGVRWASIIGALKIFMEYPLFGAGITNFNNLFYLKYGETMTTCTFINWFAMYGIFYGAFMCNGLYRFASIYSHKLLIRLLLITILFACIMSEDYTLNPSIMLLVLYGFMAKRDQRGANISKYGQKNIRDQYL